MSSLRELGVDFANKELTFHLIVSWLRELGINLVSWLGKLRIDLVSWLHELEVDFTS